jgi:hypothetical protein
MRNSSISGPIGQVSNSSDSFNGSHQPLDSKPLPSTITVQNGFYSTFLYRYFLNLHSTRKLTPLKLQPSALFIGEKKFCPSYVSAPLKKLK